MQNVSQMYAFHMSVSVLLSILTLCFDAKVTELKSEVNETDIEVTEPDIETTESDTETTEIH
jgi:hypothetical protein